MKKRVQYAGFWVRLLALCTDVFMIMLPINIVLGLVFGFDSFRAEEPNPLLSITHLVIVTTVFAYFTASGRQTPGKKLAKIVVVDRSLEGGISFVRAAFRFLFYFVSFFSIIGFLIPLFRKDKAALHDLLSRTVVIYDR